MPSPILARGVGYRSATDSGATLPENVRDDDGSDAAIATLTVPVRNYVREVLESERYLLGRTGCEVTQPPINGCN